MLGRLKNAELKIKVWMLAVALIAASFNFLWPTTAEAHSDSRIGPVVTAAKKALETGEVNYILPYVKPDAEAELTAAFKHTLEARKLGEAAREVADNYFFETAVRLHRAGEGAPYTGLKDEPTDEAIVVADKALETGSLDELYTLLNETLRHNLEEKYHAVVLARDHAAKEGTVAANRERVEAELLFEKYVYELHSIAAGSTSHHEGE
jgi:hypothetical protein